MCWRDPGSLRFEGASIIIRDAYDDTVGAVASVAVDICVSRLVEDKDDWDLSYIKLWSNSNVSPSLLVDFTAIPTQCCELNLTVTYKAGDVFGLVLQGLDAFQDSAGGKARIASFEANGTEHLTNISALESHERELLGENVKIGVLSINWLLSGPKRAS